MKEWINPELVPFDWEQWEKDFIAGKTYIYAPYVPLTMLPVREFRDDAPLSERLITRFPKE